MNEVPQMASAMLALAFAPAMLVAGQLFIEYRSTNNAFELAFVKPTSRQTTDIIRTSRLVAITGQARSEGHALQAQRRNARKGFSVMGAAET